MDKLLPVTSYSRHRMAGFTLIELLVVVGIIGILTAVGVASYNSFNESRVIRSLAGEIESNLRLAQSNAISGKKDDNCTDYLEGWYVDLEENYVYPKCGNDSGVEKKDLVSEAGGVEISSSKSGFLFKAMTGDTNLASDLTITVGGSVYLEISITGEIGLASGS